LEVKKLEDDVKDLDKKRNDEHEKWRDLVKKGQDVVLPEETRKTFSVMFCSKLVLAVWQAAIGVNYMAEREELAIKGGKTRKQLDDDKDAQASLLDKAQEFVYGAMPVRSGKCMPGDVPRYLPTLSDNWQAYYVQGWR